MGRRIDEFAALDKSRRLGEPRRVPKRADFAPSLVSRSRAAIEAFKRGRLKEQSSHCGLPLQYKQAYCRPARHNGARAIPRPGQKNWQKTQRTRACREGVPSKKDYFAG